MSHQFFSNDIVALAILIIIIAILGTSFCGRQHHGVCNE
ncbi:hypothetical protein EDD73_105147 [Heliophilum fasciatum]|uniref:Uncharacterized protein n=1 Tax=Heliophilum fasciatum TaxID=35700 RepID=A0A4R2RW90_9FIRM|nr:hypothetical protein [Heliophilum fasciatum]TCP67249.1 hypothetical protein EDD73_105147 [Heliophilum fasciatum]